MTPLMDAAELAQAFNACTERVNWRAYVGGSRTSPTVIFKSRTAMVELTYYTQTATFAVVFSKATCAFGDFMGATHRALLTVLTAVKASGYPVSAPVELDDGVLRIQYDPRTKVAHASLAALDDNWEGYAPTLTLTTERQIAAEDNGYFKAPVEDIQLRPAAALDEPEADA